MKAGEGEAGRLGHESNAIPNKSHTIILNQVGTKLSPRGTIAPAHDKYLEGRHLLRELALLLLLVLLIGREGEVEEDVFERGLGGWGGIVVVAWWRGGVVAWWRSGVVAWRGGGGCVTWPTEKSVTPRAALLFSTSAKKAARV